MKEGVKKMKAAVLAIKVHKFIPKDGKEPIQGVKIFLGTAAENWDGFLPIRNKEQKCFSDFVTLTKLKGYVPTPGDVVDVEFAPGGGIVSIAPATA